MDAQTTVHRAWKSEGSSKSLKTNNLDIDLGACPFLWLASIFNRESDVVKKNSALITRGLSVMEFQGPIADCLTYYTYIWVSAILDG